MNYNFFRFRLIIPFLFIIIFVCGCEKSSSSPPESTTAVVDNSLPKISPHHVLEPELTLDDTIGDSPFQLDISNKDLGYMYAIADKATSRFYVQLTGPDNVSYSYFINSGEKAVIPFSSGSGCYMVCAYQNLEGDQYAALYSDNIEVSLKNEFYPFLYPNQYVNFSSKSKCSQLAISMLDENASDIDALEAIYNYVTSNVTYDYEKADSVESGYMPSVDDTLKRKKGICFDFAALMTAMLRSRDIPCKLQIGYSNTVKHAWIDVYIETKGWVDKAITFDGDTWNRMDPTFASANDSKDTESYVGDGTNYEVQFSR